MQQLLIKTEKQNEILREALKRIIRQNVKFTKEWKAGVIYMQETAKQAIQEADKLT